MRYKIFPLLAALAAAPAGAQQTTRASLPVVSAPGWYKILVTPEVSAYSRPDGGDVRIIDAAGNEVPYLHGTDAMALGRSFQPFRILGQSTGEGVTRLTLSNSANKTIETLLLRVRNTDAQRTASLSGSEDGKTFYALRDSLLLEVAPLKDDTGFCVIPTPATRYPILRLDIFDRSGLPLEIFSAGVYKEEGMPATYTEAPQPAFTRTDSSDRKTYINIRFAKPYRVDRLDFHFAGPLFYKRAAVLRTAGAPAIHFTASHTGTASAWTTLHATEALVVIDNEDNPPLQLQGISAWQQRRYLLAHLGAGGTYSLRFGDSTRAAPLYDLRFFKDSIAARALQELVPGPVRALPVASAPVTPSKPYMSKVILWAIILLVLAGLVAATLSLMRQIKARTR